MAVPCCIKLMLLFLPHSNIAPVKMVHIPYGIMVDAQFMGVCVFGAYGKGDATFVENTQFS